MKEIVDHQHRPEPITVHTESGVATFQKEATGEATLEVAYAIPTQTEEVNGETLAPGIEKLCEAEIQQMRSAMKELGGELTALLNDAGRSPNVNRTWRNKEHRSWADDGNKFEIAASRATIRDNISGHEGTSEKKLVEEHIRLMIEQREENIRDIYRNILNDAEQRRAVNLSGDESQ